MPEGQPNIVRATGQTISVPSLTGATLLGFLGSAACEDMEQDGQDATGTVTITYTDRSTKTEQWWWHRPPT